MRAKYSATIQTVLGHRGRAMLANRNWVALRQKVDAARTQLASAEVRPNRSMCYLLVVGEDHRIALHPVVDPLALCRAAWRTYGCGQREGGSTVAMQ